MIRSMGIPTKKIPKPKLSLEGRQVLSAMRRGVRLAKEEYRKAGIPMAIWRDGRVVLFHP